jgi:phosphotransacetylase
MKFEIKQNIFETGVKNVNLTDKEADYIIALASGVAKDKIVKSLSITEDEIEQLYKKFGLKNKDKVRDIQLVTLTCMGNFISEYFDNYSDKDFQFEECQELVQTVIEMQKNDKKFKEEIMKVVEEELESRFEK